MLGLDYGLMGCAMRQRTSVGFSPTDVSGLIAWYDPSDLTTLFQDAAMTIPVTADGQSVGAMRDKSGAGYHLTQATALNRPLYRTNGTSHWIESDGSNDVLSGALSGVASDPNITFAVGMRILSQPDVDNRVFELGSGPGALCGGFGTTGWAWRYNNGNNIFSASTTGVDRVARWWRPAGSNYAETRFFLDGTEVSKTGGSGTSLPNIGTKAFSLFNIDTGGEGGQIRLYGFVICVDQSVADSDQIDSYLTQKLP